MKSIRRLAASPIYLCISLAAFASVPGGPLLAQPLDRWEKLEVPPLKRWEEPRDLREQRGIRLPDPDRVSLIADWPPAQPPREKENVILEKIPIVLEASKLPLQEAARPPAAGGLGPSVLILAACAGGILLGMVLRFGVWKRIPRGSKST